MFIWSELNGTLLASEISSRSPLRLKRLPNAWPRLIKHLGRIASPYDVSATSVCVKVIPFCKSSIFPNLSYRKPYVYASFVKNVAVLGSSSKCDKR